MAGIDKEFDYSYTIEASEKSIKNVNEDEILTG